MNNEVDYLEYRKVQEDMIGVVLDVLEEKGITTGKDIDTKREIG